MLGTPLDISAFRNTAAAATAEGEDDDEDEEEEGVEEDLSKSDWTGAENAEIDNGSLLLLLLKLDGFTNLETGVGDEELLGIVGGAFFGGGGLKLGGVGAEEEEVDNVLSTGILLFLLLMSFWREVGRT